MKKINVVSTKKASTKVSLGGVNNTDESLLSDVKKAEPLVDYSMNLADYILVIENALSQDLCKRILKEYQKSDLWSPTRIGGGVIDQTIRNVDSIGMSFPDMLAANPSKKLLDDEVFKSVNNAITQYNQKFPEAKITKDSGYDLLRYKKGCFYSQHVDSFTITMRTLSCSIALNDNFEGGEFAFFNRKITKQLTTGSAIVFPSTFLYPHEILPVTKGTRYSIITWLM